MTCRYCHRDALKSFNDEPVCVDCYSALLNREEFSKDKRVSQNMPDKELDFVHPKDMKLIKSLGQYYFNPMISRFQDPDFDPNQANDEYFDL